MADDAILRTVNRYHLVTAEQVCRRLYRPSVISYVRGRLSHLADARFLLRSSLLRPTRTGSGPVVYSLGPQGRAYLASLGEAVPRQLRRSVAAQYGYYHLKHALGVTDVLLAADLVARAEPRFRVQALLHEHALKRRAVTVDVAGCRRMTVCPDAWLDLRIQRAGWYQHCLAVEFDRGTEHQPAWRLKVAALLAWASGPYCALFDTTSLTIAVITSAGEPRRRALLQWTEAELSARDSVRAADLFCFSACEPHTVAPAQLFLGRDWFVPFLADPTGLFTVERGSR